MRFRTLIFGSLFASFALAAVAPAFADDDWRRHEFEEHRRHEWREHEWREHEAREHEWRERQGFYAPPPSLPFVTPRAYGYGGPPPVYYSHPRY